MGFDDLQALLETLNCDLDAAELHGILTAQACVSAVEAISDANLNDTQRFLGENIDLNGADRRELQACLEQTQDALGNGDLGFDMWLPGDDESMGMRAEGLSQWCLGFTYAFAVLEKSRHLNLSADEELAEVLQDYAAIAELDSALDDDDEEHNGTEEDYMQLSEYVRVAAMNVFVCCARLLVGDSSANDNPLTVH